MTEHEKERRLAPLRLIETYWQGLIGADGTLPLRSQIDPRGIESALEYAFLGERIAPMLAKLRVSGSHLNDLLGTETSGMPLSMLIAPEDRDQLGAAIAKLFSDGVAVRLRLVAEEGFGKGRLTGDMLLLPLRSDMGDLSRMIGALVTHGRIGRTPRRFRIESICMQAPAELSSDARLRTPAPVAPQPPASPAATPKPSFHVLAEDAAPFKHASSGPRGDHMGKRPPYLRLVVSNDD